MSSTSEASRYRLDDLRRFASALGAAVGLAPSRASALASQLLWYDAAGWPAFGLRTLPSWLERVERGEIDPKAEGTVGTEHAGTAVLDGQKGMPPLILTRAGEIAAEKAREVGVGLVRLVNLGHAGPAAGVAAEMAVGPMIAGVLGPSPSWSLALPSENGLPAVFDSALAEPREGKAAKRPAWADVMAPWASALVSGEEWLVLAVAVTALESLAAFQERVTAATAGAGEGSGRLLPGTWEATRREARARGVRIDPDAWAELSRRAEKLGMSAPSRRARLEGGVP